MDRDRPSACPVLIKFATGHNASLALAGGVENVETNFAVIFHRVVPILSQYTRTHTVSTVIKLMGNRANRTKRFHKHLPETMKNSTRPLRFPFPK